jgi:hypothetical protein
MISHPFSELAGAYSGRPAMVCGGAPCLVEDVKHAPADAMFLSANEHGCILRPCDFIVCCDNIETKLRPYGIPIIAKRKWADYRIFEKPVQNSGALAAWVAWALGCAPILVGGVEFYQGGTYHHDHSAKSSGKRVPLSHHLTMWRALLPAAPGAMIRPVSGPLTQIFPIYDSAEPICAPVPINEIRGKVAGHKVEFLRDVSETFLPGPYKKGDVDEISKRELQMLWSDKAVRVLS